MSLRGAHDGVFNDLLPFIKEADFAVMNLECPLVSDGRALSKLGPSLKAPVETVQSLTAAGFNLVTLANNHIMDFGEQGLASTMAVLAKNGIDFLGAGKDIQEARSIYYKDVRGYRLAFLNFAENEFSTTQGNKAGANPVNPVTNYYDIREARDNADIVFVIVHGGLEHYPLPSPGVKERYRFFVDAGADVVVGHHTHCVSGYELYKDAPIFYSLGNFVFDHPTKRDGSWIEGMAVEFELAGKRVHFEPIGLVQGDEDTAGVRCMNGYEREHFEKKVEHLNAIIADDKALARSWHEMIINRNHVYQAMALVGNTYLRKLINRKILPIDWFTNNTQRKMLLNVLRCETHREAVIHALEDNV
jgi:poly-gamma-glutamate synthesis protein (capsule biosynthesis protein)